MSIKTVAVSEGTLFDKYLNKKVLIYCARYIYEGTLVSHDDATLLLTGTRIVYDTGSRENWIAGKDWEVVQPFWSDTWMISKGAIESMGEVTSKK